MSIRLKLFFAIIFVVLLSLGIMRTTPAAGSGGPLSKAMETTGAKVEEFSVYAWVKFPMGELDETQLEDIVKQVMSQLGLKEENYQLIHYQKKHNKIVRAEVIRQNFHALVIAQVIPRNTNTTELEGYLIVNIETKPDNNLSITHLQEKIAIITNNFGPAPQISTCLIGWLDGKLSSGELHKYLRHAFVVIDAMIIDKLEAEHFVSYTGYTSKISEYLQVDDKRLNVNMAMRYSKYDNRTYITIASPIITQEY